MFALPAVAGTQLKIANQHDRDKRLTNNSALHLYYIDGKTVSISITGFKGMFMPDFDKDAILPGMFGAVSVFGRPPKCTPESLDEHSIYPGKNEAYIGMTRGAILQAWSNTAVTGTTVHDAIERYLDDANKQWFREPNRSARLERLISGSARPDIVRTQAATLENFLEFEDMWALKGWQIYRVEWQVFHEDYDLAGTIDAVYKRVNPVTQEPEYCIVDWKVSGKDFAVIQGREKRCLPPISKLDNNNLTGYFLQVHIYGKILKEKYGLNIVSYALVQLPPANPREESTTEQPAAKRKKTPSRTPPYILLENTLELTSEVDAIFKTWNEHRQLSASVAEWERRGGGMMYFLPDVSHPLTFQVRDEYSHLGSSSTRATVTAAPDTIGDNLNKNTNTERE